MTLSIVYRLIWVTYINMFVKIGVTVTNVNYANLLPICYEGDLYDPVNKGVSL